MLSCLECGVEFYVSPCYRKRGARYCSRKCAGQSNRKWSDGERGCYLCNRILKATTEFFYPNPSKHDGWSTECKDCIAIKTKARVLKRKKFILERGNECAFCGIKSDNHRFFEIDHVVPLMRSGKKRTQYRYDDDDYQVLCPNCHKLKTIKDFDEK